MTETLSPNPLRSGLRLGRTAPPAVMVIFGATGDLAHRKLLPALYNLELDGLLPVGFTIVGVARRPMTDDEFRAQVKASIDKFSRRPITNAVWDRFLAGIRYWKMEFDDPQGYAGLAKFLTSIDEERGTGGNRLYYLSVPPSLFAGIVQQLGTAGMCDEDGHFSRIIVEKPFGHDLASAKALNAEVNRVFGENQVYRIDHYLGKETVQNILVFRFANGIWEPIWNRRYIDSVQITVAETLGVGSRAGYYEEAGALRDMVANHMMQLVTLMCMEPPVDFGADSVRDEKVKVLRAVERMDQSLPDNLIRGQYVAGWSGGQPVKGYHEEDGVAPDSSTETYVALKLSVDNWRWAGVPFYLRHGKRLPKRTTEIAIQFKMPPRQLFAGVAQGDLIPNTLVLRIQPGDGIGLRILAKGPGASIQLRPVTMDFLYGTSFDADVPEAYERLVLDCLLGDSTLFARRDEVETTWAIFDGVLRKEQSDQLPCQPYEAGSWGPAAADELIERDGRHWRRL